MIITKFSHSCVLVQEGEKAVLFDPGMFSWQSGLINVAEIPRLDAVIITHLHPDHFSEPFVSAIFAAQPEVQWIAPPEIFAQLEKLDITKFSSESVGDLQVTVGQHAYLGSFAPPAQNLTIHYLNKVTAPGDSHEFSETKDLLFLPVEAPWGSSVNAIELAKKLKPKYVLPVHDWMWKDEWRTLWYGRFKNILAQSGIIFLEPKDAEPIEIPL